MHLFPKVALPLGPTQPPLRWVTEVLSLGVKQTGRDMTTHFHMEKRLKISKTVGPFSHTLWCARSAYKQESKHCSPGGMPVDTQSPYSLNH